MLEQFAFRVEPLDDRFDHDLALREMAEPMPDLEQTGRTGRRVGGHLALVRELRERADDLILRRGRRVGAAVVEHDVNAGLRGDLRDAASHHAGADDADGEIRALRVEGHVREWEDGRRRL